MKKLILTAILVIIAATYVFSQETLSIAFAKATTGDLMMYVRGHTVPVVVKIGDKQITLQIDETEVNLTKLGISELTDVSVEEVDTAAGTTANTDTQNPIPPVSPYINPNPPLTTPY